MTGDATRLTVSTVSLHQDDAASVLERAGVEVVAPGDERAEAVVVVGGVGAVRAVAALEGPPILVLMRGIDRRSVTRALDAGADAVLDYDAGSVQVRAALMALRVGLTAYPRLAHDTLTPTLTLRQQEILGLVVLGLSNAEIARRLYLTESTVKSHLHSAFRTLSVRSRREAVAKLLDPDSEHAAGVVGLATSGRGNAAYRRPSVKS